MSKPKTTTEATKGPEAGLLTEQRGNLLRDTVSVKLQLDESAEAAGKIVVRGEFGRAGIATENKRVYPRSLWEREFKRLNMNLENRQVFGELDHPTDGRTSLNRVSHVITNLQLGEDGIVSGAAEVLGTERGNNLSALLKAGCSVGVSSRGYGSTKTNEMGEEVVQEDYRLVTFDFVAEPADTKAIPSVFFEENQHMPTTEQELEAQLSEERTKLKEEFATELVATLIKVKSEARESAKAEMLSDPEVAGAKLALEQILGILRPFASTTPVDVTEEKEAEITKLKEAIAERDEKIVSLNGDIEKLVETSREVGYKLFVEQQLLGDPEADLIRKVLGDLKSFDKANDIKIKIESIRMDLNKQREEREAAAAEIQREAERVEALVRAETHIAQLETKKAQAEAAQLQEALTKALEGQKEVALRLYAEKKLVNHPQASKVRNILESAHPANKEEVDQILGSYGREPKRDPDVLEQTRSRVRTMTHGGSGSTTLDEEVAVPDPRRQQDFAGLGVSLNELQHLSGIDRK